MKKLLQRLIADDCGQDLAEYGIALAVIGTVVVLAVGSISTNVQQLWTAASAQIASVAGN
jgi:Flp pilus assembly pilin Flp